MELLEALPEGFEELILLSLGPLSVNDAPLFQSFAVEHLVLNVAVEVPIVVGLEGPHTLV